VEISNLNRVAQLTIVGVMIGPNSLASEEKHFKPCTTSLSTKLSVKMCSCEREKLGSYFRFGGQKKSFSGGNK
jgi:hypothetical protein